MTRRWRTLRYGASVGLAVVGVACGATIPGTLGGTLATALIGFGLVGVLSLVFYEIGLSEDRDRARGPAQSPGAPPTGDENPPAAEAPPAGRGAPARPHQAGDGIARRHAPERRRGQRRRLR